MIVLLPCVYMRNIKLKVFMYAGIRSKVFMYAGIMFMYAGIISKVFMYASIRSKVFMYASIRSKVFMYAGIRSTKQYLTIVARIRPLDLREANHVIHSPPVRLRQAHALVILQ